MQVINPEGFAGLDYFKREMSLFTQNARNTPTPEGAPAVRMPGQRGLALRREQTEHGVALYPEILPALAPYVERYSLEMVQSI